MTKREGSIISIDGPDGSGKTTQLELLAEFLRGQGYDVHSTRGSGGTPIGEELRTVSLSDVSRPAEVDVYISLAMHTALGQDIQARKARGQVVLVDRSPLAVIAYNMYGSQLSDKQLGFDACERLLRLWNMDALILFEAGQDVLNARRAARTDKPQDYFERQTAAYYDRVREGYKVGAKFIRDLTGLRTKVVHFDAGHSVESMQADLQQRVLALLV